MQSSSALLHYIIVDNSTIGIYTFCEEAPEFHVIAAESLLGVAIPKGTSFPVGKAEVDFVVQDEAYIVPVEVKSGSVGRARSLLEYRKKYSPEKLVMTSLDTAKRNVLPLYAFWNLKAWLH